MKKANIIISSVTSLFGIDETFVNFRELVVCLYMHNTHLQFVRPKNDILKMGLLFIELQFIFSYGFTV